MSLIQERTIDKTYFTLVVILIGLGFVILYSASSSLAAAKFNDPGYYMRGHLLRILAGVVAGLFFLIIDYKLLKPFAFWIAFLSLLLLLGTFVFNKIYRPGSPARWIPLGFFNAQPSEFAKLAIIVYFASFLDRKKLHLDNFKSGYLPPILILLLTIALVIIEPDFSTAAVIAIIGMIMLFIGGARLLHLIVSIVVMGSVSAITILRSPYKISRITSFLSNNTDIQGAGYQINQSLISLGNGGFWGKGLASSIEKNLFLPDPHTDFVFSVAGEEFGFFGAMILLTLFLALFLRGLKISSHSDDNFGRLLGIGLSCSLFIYVLLNIGVVCRMVPVTGLPLPFLSYGGSTMIYNLCAAGIILNISKNTTLTKRKQNIPIIYG